MHARTSASFGPVLAQIHENRWIQAEARPDPFRRLQACMGDVLAWVPVEHSSALHSADATAAEQPRVSN